MRGVMIIGLVVATMAHAAPPHIGTAWSLYDRYCLSCHGANGDGRGPAAPYTWGRPRDFTRGEFKWGGTRDALMTVLRHGVPGTSMPATVLTDRELSYLIDVLRGFAGTPVSSNQRGLGSPPPSDAARGAELWQTRGCATCHGADGRGKRDLATPPYDLTTEPLHRPRAHDDVPSRRWAAALSIARGMTGTPMPSYGGSISDADVWALADHVIELNAHAERRGMALDADAIAADRKAHIRPWPADDVDEGVLFGTPIEAQGTPPATLAPAEASLDAQQCARCHAKQFREWRDSLHGAAGSPGLIAQIDYMPAKEAAACRRCHAPLVEQSSGPLRVEGVSCAGCHVRKWTRRGPPNVSPSLLRDPSYPLTTLAIYERADFCMPCHQLPPRDEVDGRPLLDTYREWLEGPYARRGVQCQHCHMPNREHQFLGIHDPATFKQGIQLTATARHIDRSIAVVAELRNVGAGHYLPTTTTPALWIVIELVDDKGIAIAGATSRMRIGRDLKFDGSWHELEDTRIPPGEQRMMARAWSGGRTKEAMRARITVEVHPDDYYEHFYEARLAATMPAAQRALYEQALARTRRSQYRGELIDVSIGP